MFAEIILYYVKMLLLVYQPPLKPRYVVDVPLAHTVIASAVLCIHIQVQLVAPFVGSFEFLELVANVLLAGAHMEGNFMGSKAAHHVAAHGLSFLGAGQGMLKAENHLKGCENIGLLKTRNLGTDLAIGESVDKEEVADDAEEKGRVHSEKGREGKVL